MCVCVCERDRESLGARLYTPHENNSLHDSLSEKGLVHKICVPWPKIQLDDPQTPV